MVAQNEQRAAQQIEEAQATIDRAIRRSSGTRREQLVHVQTVLTKIVEHLNEFAK